MKHERAFSPGDEPESMADAIARARASHAAGSGVEHRVVGEWLKTWGADDRRTFKEWLAAWDG